MESTYWSYCIPEGPFDRGYVVEWKDKKITFRSVVYPNYGATEMNFSKDEFIREQEYIFSQNNTPDNIKKQILDFLQSS